MAVASTPLDVLLTHGFDYTEAKSRYLEQVRLYYSNRRVPTVSAFTRDVVNKIKHLIKEQRILKAAGHHSDHAKYRVTSRYELMEQNGDEFLICKRLTPDDPIVKVVPAEDCFDILVDAHLKTNHGNRDKMSRFIKTEKYVVPKTSVDFLIVVCKVCQLNGKVRNAYDKVEPVFHSRGQVSIIDMTAEPDNKFKYILCYLDRYTRFMLLRPLLTDSIQETAMELLKIFLDFGPPHKLDAYNRPFFIKVLSLINTVHNEFNISCVLPVKMPDITPNDVRTMLRNWKKETNSKNWAIGCYMIQWKNNTAIKSNSIIKKTPYSSVFQGCYATKIHGHEALVDVKENEISQDEELSNDIITSFEVNDDSPVPLENDNRSNFLITLHCEPDGQEVLVVEEGSEDEEDCLITITEAPKESAPTIIAVPNNLELDKRPNILKKRALLKTYPANPNNSSTTSFNTYNTSSMNNDQTKKALKQKQSCDEIKLPEAANKKCHVCKTTILKAYTCTKCNRNVHLYCSDRLLQPNISPDVLTVNCTSCRLKNTRFEKMKRKFDEMDSDKTDKSNTTIKH